ncbi:MAG: acetate--CoA ligase family protein [Candidatus Kerfeldbacteria bacterium]|nr:acetate--CoA ligase family protein [Candidatus Kerfeldbacteria bacterium]
MLERLLSPRSIAVIGASHTVGKLGYEVYNNCVQFGFTGSVYPVNSKGGKIRGKKCYASVGAIEKEIDVAVIVVPKDAVVSVVEECGKKQIPYVVIISAGFRETGDEGASRERQIETLAKKYAIRVLGPNCLGFIVPKAKLNASFTEGLPKSGGVALVSQSGAMCVSILDWAQDSGMGFSTVLTIGNKLDISEIEALQYLEKDPDTSVIALYLESVERGQELLQLARRITVKKPIVLIKSGVSQQGERAVQSHTGSLAGSREAINALCQKAGIMQVHSVQEFFDVILILSCGRIPQGSNIGILTNAGGPGVLTVDAMENTLLSLAHVSGGTQNLLRSVLPASASVKNPIDIIGDATPERYEQALNIFAPMCDALIVILTPQIMTDPLLAAKNIISVYKKNRTPIMCSFMGGGSLHQARTLLHAAGIPHVSTPERAVRALDVLERARKNEGMVVALEEKTTASFTLSSNTDRVQLSTQAVEEFLNAHDIRAFRSQLLHSSFECDRIRHFPVVMKIASRDIIHKSAVGGVQVNIGSVTEAQQAFERITRTVRSAHPEAELEGVLVQPLLSYKQHDREMFIGIKKDFSCGMVMVCGVGGTAVEVLKDVSYGIAPLSTQEAMHMVRSLKSFPLLAHNDISAFAELLVKVSQIGVQYTGFSSLDMNPVVLHERNAGYTILDARILL